MSPAELGPHSRRPKACRILDRGLGRQTGGEFEGDVRVAAPPGPPLL